MRGITFPHWMGRRGCETGVTPLNVKPILLTKQLLTQIRYVGKSLGSEDLPAGRDKRGKRG